MRAKFLAIAAVCALIPGAAEARKGGSGAARASTPAPKSTGSTAPKPGAAAPASDSKSPGGFGVFVYRPSSGAQSQSEEQKREAGGLIPVAPSPPSPPSSIQPAAAQSPPIGLTPQILGASPASEQKAAPGFSVLR